MSERHDLPPGARAQLVALSDRTYSIVTGLHLLVDCMKLPRFYNQRV